ncbi:MAG: amidase [Gemmatimonadales bacterium]
MSERELCFLPATELAGLLRRGAVSAVEVLDAHLARIERANPELNAIVTLTAEAARRAAREADERRARGEPLGVLHGIPIAHKDLTDTAGVRTTYGSPLFRDHVPTQDSLLVERIRAAGAISVGKTNVPEFGAGSQTFNEVFGTTLNPYDLARTSGGSSGGAAVALASGMVPLADGSDLGGSLRNPASFCNVVGFRPSAGRVPTWPAEDAWFTMGVDGPMARTVEDAALLLSVLAGPDPRSPLARSEPGRSFAPPLHRQVKGTRIAWVRDLGLPFEPAVRAVVDRARPVLESLGCVVEDAEPSLTGAEEVFSTWRAWYFAMRLSRFLEREPERLKDTVRWNVEEGLRLTGQDLARAEILRTRLFHRLRAFMESYPFFVLPTVQVVPFDARTPYPTEIEGVAMRSYLDWMRSCSLISATGHPALSVPAGFTPEGLPVGLQIVGRLGDDLGVLRLGAAFEAATRWWRRRPPI